MARLSGLENVGMVDPPTVVTNPSANRALWNVTTTRYDYNTPS